ncbi:MAG: putative lipid-binding transport protein (Tim44 family) [Lysobacterales bacterium]|jgi:predicted lipid-binding transport protein (Tim44 family)
MAFYISPPPRGPLGGILAGIVGVLIMTGVFMLGFIAIIVALSVGFLIWVGIYVRLWWAKRKMLKQGIDPASLNPFANDTRPKQSDSLDAEYEVISKTQDE